LIKPRKLVLGAPVADRDQPFERGNLVKFPPSLRNLNFTAGMDRLFGLRLPGQLKILARAKLTQPMKIAFDVRENIARHLEFQIRL
jgi:hypothetical protein